MKIKTFGSVDERSLEQLKRCMEAGDAQYGVLCADHHPGYSQPIGGAVAYEGYVSPSGVGYDIGCGNKAACTQLTMADLEQRARGHAHRVVNDQALGAKLGKRERSQRGEQLGRVVFGQHRLQQRERRTADDRGGVEAQVGAGADPQRAG